MNAPNGLGGVREHTYTQTDRQMKNQTNSDTGEICGKMGMIRERKRERERERLKEKERKRKGCMREREI